MIQLLVYISSEVYQESPGEMIDVLAKILMLKESFQIDASVIVLRTYLSYACTQTHVDMVRDFIVLTEQREVEDIVKRWINMPLDTTYFCSSSTLSSFVLHRA